MNLIIALLASLTTATAAFAGASRNGSPSGAGGNGAPGRVVIITYARNE